MWRLLAKDASGGRDLDVTNAGVFDELVVDGWFHLEWMEADRWWLRIGDARITVDVSSEPPIVDVERGFYARSSGATVLDPRTPGER
jgi:hypothetical protein